MRMKVEYTLTSANAVRKPHVGLVVNAYYKRDPLDHNEIPLKITVFNRWPKVTMMFEQHIVDIAPHVKR